MSSTPPPPPPPPGMPPSEPGPYGSQPPAYGQQPYQQPYSQPYQQPYSTQPYGQPYGGGPSPFDSRGTTVLVLGILSLLVCGPVLGPIAWVMGNGLKRDATAAGYAEPGTGKGGRICGMIATILSILAIGFVIVAIIIGAANSNN